MPRSPRYTDAQLIAAVQESASIAAVQESASIAAVLRKLGIKESGGSHTHVSRRIKRSGLDTSHFTGQAHIRGRRLARMGPGDSLRRVEPGSNHIDGDPWNCEFANLRFLGPNCPSQAPTYCRRLRPQPEASPSSA